jgi:hypothetical protein
MENQNITFQYFPDKSFKGWNKIVGHNLLTIDKIEDGLYNILSDRWEYSTERPDIGTERSSGWSVDIENKNKNR